jgi:hypothetical protein
MAPIAHLISHHPSLRRALAGGGDPQDIDGGCCLSVIDELRSDRQACAHSSFSLFLSFAPPVLCPLSSVLPRKS